jgi:hypothetical protein
VKQEEQAEEPAELPEPPIVAPEGRNDGAVIEESASVEAQKNNREVINIRVPTPPLPEPAAAAVARPRRPADVFKAVIPQKQTLNGFTLSFSQREMVPKGSKQMTSNN